MSNETLQHLNIHTLIGNTDQRGTAWHYRAEHQGEESNHYPGPIPVGDVERRLFHWDAVSRRVGVEVTADIATMTHLDDEGVPMRWQVIEDKQAICRDDTEHLMGIFTPGYQMHQYREWLLTTRRRHPRRRPLDLLRRSAARRSGRLGRGLGPGVDHHARGRRVPAQPAGHHQLRRLHRHHLQAHRHRRGLRQHPGSRARRERARRSRSGTPATPAPSSAQHARRSPWSTPSPTTSPTRSRPLCATVVTDRTWERFLDAYVPRVRNGVPVTGQDAHPGRQEARHPQPALPPRPARRTLGRNRPRRHPGRQHLRAPRGHRARHHQGGAQHAPHRHRRLRQDRPPGAQHPQLRPGLIGGVSERYLRGHSDTADPDGEGASGPPPRSGLSFRCGFTAVDCHRARSGQPHRPPQQCRGTD